MKTQTTTTTNISIPDDPSEPIIEVRQATWDVEISDIAETISEVFAAEWNENWASIGAIIPFHWSCRSRHDGLGGPPCYNPMEFWVYLSDSNFNPAVIRKYDIKEILLDISSGGATKDWHIKTAESLESLAKELRAAEAR